MWQWNKEIQQSTYSQPKLAYDDLQAIQSLYGHKSHSDTVRKLNPTTLEPLSTTPQLVSSIFTGFPDNSAVDAAVTFKGPWSKERSYLITGSQYYRYSLDRSGRMSADPEYPKTFHTVWGEFARGHTIDTSFTYKNKNTLVFIIVVEIIGTKYCNVIEAGIDAGFLHPNGTNYSSMMVEYTN